MTPPLPGELARRPAAFVGRRDELAALDAAWRRTLAGTRQVVFVSGEPGIGKTRLVGELATAAHANGSIVLHGHCDPEVLLPYQPFVECFRQLAAVDDPELDTFVRSRRQSLSRVLPELVRSDDGVGEGDGESERARLFAASAALLRFAAERAPVLLVIDDLHWASAPTVQLLRHLLRSTEGLRVLIAATYRDTEVARASALASLLADLRTEGGIERVALEGLEVKDVADLAAATTGTAPGPVGTAELVQAIYADTAGNPFFVNEVFRHLLDTGALLAGDDGWTLAAPLDTVGLPERVRDVLTLRLARLPDHTRQHLAAAAVIGPRFDLATLTALALEGDALDSIEPALTARLVTEVDEPVGRFRFAHALVRQALLDDLGATRRARLHEQVGQALEAAGVPGAEVARHYLGAARDDLVERGARIALDAARSVTWRSAPEAAIELVAQARRALGEVPGHDLVLEVDLLCEEAMALVVLQRNIEFLDVAGKAVAVARASGSLAAFAQAVAARACYTPTGNTDETFITDIEEALRVVDESELSLRSRLHSGLAIGMMMMNRDRYVALDHANEAAVLADQAGALFDRWMARFAASLAAFCGPGTDEMARLGEELQRIGDEYDDENARCHGLRTSVVVDLYHGDLDRHTEVIADCARRWGAVHNAWGVAVGVVARYVDAAARGRFDEAEAVLEELVTMGAHDANFAAVYAGELIMLRELQGRLGEIQPLIDMFASSYPAILSLRIVDGLARLELGREEEAREIAHSVLESPDMGTRDYMELSRLAWAVQLAAELCDVELLAPVAERLAAWEGLVLVVNVGTAILGRVEAYLGLARSAVGDDAGADRLFAVALEWEQASGCRPLTARTQLWWARALAGRDPARAAALLDQCIETCAALDIQSIGSHASALRASIS
jgi:hypothetical protein